MLIMSSVQCPPSPTYQTSIEQKLHSKKAARQYQFGSPKLRDLLREKCRVRVREARQASFDCCRTVGKVGENTLVSKILRQELADLESDINLQEHIYKELITEMNLWFAQQIEEEEEYLIEVADADIVFCPVCQKDVLMQNEKLMFCNCGTLFEFSGSVGKLNEIIQNTIQRHEINCSQQLNFFTEQDSIKKHYNLNVLCEACDFFVSL